MTLPSELKLREGRCHSYTVVTDSKGMVCCANKKPVFTVFVNEAWAIWNFEKLLISVIYCNNNNNNDDDKYNN